MNINKLMVCAMTASLGLFAYGNLPVVSNVTMTQDSSRNVTITYDLSTSAVITLDVQTNANTSASADDPGWTSIGGVAVSNARGDIWKKVEAGSHTITWRPDLSWPGYKIANGGARAVVTAWALNNTPDYMVVDISDAAQPNTQRYYPAVDFLPGSALGQTGAVTNNPAYKTTMIVMRKIMAKGVTWTMGSTDSELGRDVTKEATHQVALTNNYYIGVFEVTQTQWALIHQGANDFPSKFKNKPDHVVRPVEEVCFNEIRMGDGTAAAADSLEWPGAPHSSSFLGSLRTKTGIDFDLPSEAQWEFAARAGNGNTKWGDGSYIMSAVKCTNLMSLGRYYYNAGEDAETAVVGSYKANDWGLYDMHGNAWEWCLDWYANDIRSLEGAVNTDSASGTRVLRSGAYNQDAKFSRPACRTLAREPSFKSPTGVAMGVGFRLACRAGLD